jgi:hypothetical protein
MLAITAGPLAAALPKCRSELSASEGRRGYGGRYDPIILVCFGSVGVRTDRSRPGSGYATDHAWQP